MVFNSGREKMERDSNTNNTLSQFETWWRALPPVEQQSVKNIDNKTTIKAFGDASIGSKKHTDATQDRLHSSCLRK
jgi:hypothetical protein